MFRTRRYRVVLLFAVICVSLLYRLPFLRRDRFDSAIALQKARLASSDNSQSDTTRSARIANYPGNLQPAQANDPIQIVDQSTARPSRPQPHKDEAVNQQTRPNSSGVPAGQAPDNKPATKEQETTKDGDSKTQDEIPPRLPSHQGEQDGVAEAQIQVHWRKPDEHFPISPKSMIRLPKGTSKTIPRIQFNFGPESTKTRPQRLQRLAAVKKEAMHAWSGYKKYAWTHDELAPTTNSSRDPFCGWAATTVDALDTLWIMGMKDDFEEAVEAIKKIDFTYSTTMEEIPVFETTIRYIGGLLGAFDVSGGHKGGYTILLDKAVELAEILMDIFDTPNRMPILFYNWKSASASPVKRAGLGKIADFGTLSLEFTHLAQLTKEDKYYDAVARITDSLEDWQRRGVLIPGLFPEEVDASGCNKTAADEALRIATERQAEANTQYAMTPGDQENKVKNRKGGSPPPLQRRQSTRTKSTKHETQSIPDMYGKLINQKTQGEPYYIDGLDPKECYPQGLVARAGRQQFSMGGSQDSAYEYFAKQYLLLGGLEPKYHVFYSNTVEAIKKWLLYRPMVPGDRDILFSAKALTDGNPDDDLLIEFENTHLACFLGGMFGMGGKIFGNSDDVEIGKKLADGCVWAYQSTPSGIMPEYGVMMPCADASGCHWNETVYKEGLDPLARTRDEQVRMFDKKMLERKEQESRQLQQERRAAEEKAALEKIREGKEKNSLMHDDRRGNNAENQGTGPVQKRDIENVELQRPLSHEEFVESLIADQGLPPGFVAVPGRNYILRPEAIESVWYMYRITGDPVWQERGWTMFEAIVKASRTISGHSSIANVLTSDTSWKTNEMQSFWLAETLKYFYLLFETPDVVSLDEYVLNTEAHPFRRPS